MPKKGQITLFVIIGIIIMILTIILILIYSRHVERISREEITSTLSITSTINNVNNLVNLCFSELADSVIYEAGKHGGYAALDSNFWRELPESDRWGAEDHPQYMPLVYLKCGSVNLMPSVESVEESLERSIKYSLENEDCLNNFNDLTEQGWIMEGEEIDVSAVINDDAINLELFIPRTFTKNENSFNINKYSYKSNVNFPFYLDKARDVIYRSMETLDRLIEDNNNLLLSGVLTEEEALIKARDGVDSVLEEIGIELDSDGYDFFHVMSLDPPPECSIYPELFLIKNRENNFRFVFGASL